jgi:hypothetical protein
LCISREIVYNGIATLGSAVQGFGSHHYISGKGTDAGGNSLIIGCYDQIIEQKAFFRLFINPLDHGFPLYIHQWFSRKAAGAVPGRYHPKDLHC